MSPLATSVRVTPATRTRPSATATWGIVCAALFAVACSSGGIESATRSTEPLPSDDAASVAPIADAAAETGRADAGATSDVAQTDAAQSDAAQSDAAQSDAAKALDAAAIPDAMVPDGQATAPVVVTDVAMTEIAIFQGVKVPLMKGGAPAASTYAPIVAGRPALVRVYLAPSATYTARELTAELTLTTQVGTVVRTSRSVIAKASTESAIDSSINFTLSADDLPSGAASFKVRVLSPTAGVGPAAAPAQYPADPGTAPLEFTTTGKLRIVLVPVRYDADGSGRLPDTSAATIESYRAAFFERYPASAVDVTVRTAPMAWSQPIETYDEWKAVLSQVAALRAQDNPASDVYYLGIFQPAATYAALSGKSCCAGLGYLLSTGTEVNLRAAVAVSYNADAWSLNASVAAATHELGHQHGRVHVANSGTNPRCGTPTNTDPSYPYGGDGTIGSWGYGLLDKKVYDPATTTDIMGYCHDSEWVSDYTYGAFLARLKSVSLPTKGLAVRGGEYRFIEIAEDGRLSWGPTVDLPSAPTNYPITVRAVDKAGNIRNITGYYYPTGDGEGATLLVRKSDAADARIEVDLQGRTRSLF